MQYLSVWRKNLTYAKLSEEREFNVKQNITRKTVAKDDPKKMWKIIDYKDNESILKQDIKLSPETVQLYFKNIYQADHLFRNPTISLVKEELKDYNIVNEQLDQRFTYKELNDAIMQIGKGIGIDGVDKNISHLLPKQLRVAILKFCNLVFRKKYPNDWSYQILRPEIKKGHTLKNPKHYHHCYPQYTTSCWTIDFDFGTKSTQNKQDFENYKVALHKYLQYT